VTCEKAATSGASDVRRRTSRRFVLSSLAVFAVALVVALAVFAWVKVPDIYPVSTAKDLTLLAAAESARAQAITTTRASVLAALAGLGALVTIAINYRNSRTAAETLAVTNQTFRIQQRAHLTDRYTKAIEQLGNSESIAIRLGGIYALEQIAVDTDRASDQATVVEVLSAFFRTSITQLHTTTKTPPSPPPPDSSPSATPRMPPPEPPLELAADVLAAMSVLSRLPRRQGIDRTDLGDAAANAHLTPGLRPHADLAGALLAEAHLAGANLIDADLADADLAYSHLFDANLTGANLTSANLFNANLTEANLTDADVTRASLASTVLTRADLTRADLAGAVLAGAHLGGANLTDARLTDAHLTDAHLASTHGLLPGQLTQDQARAAASLPANWPKESPTGE
jgi:pentapeptide repeat protein